MTSFRLGRSLLLATALAAPAALLAPPSAVAQTVPAPAPAPTPADTPTPSAQPVKPLSGSLEPKWGSIRTFWGESSPLWGSIRTFWGDVNPYEGDVNAFWGSIRTFNDGSDPDAIAPLWGSIRTFSGDLGASWGSIRTFWGSIRTFEEAPQDYAMLATMLSGMVNQSQDFWGSAVQAQTGQSFADAFANPLLAKYGISLSDSASLGRLDANQREHFFLEWYDGLTNFSGADHVDHWMSAIHWTPSITETIGEGRDSVIGLLDFSVTGDGTKNITKYDGISSFSNGHGAAVASLMIAAHDGKGVMGIAPMASVVAYNPFDETGTAGWSDIRNGVLMLAQNGASIINMSLGVPGWTLHQGWNDVFSDAAVAAATKNAVFVVAAGNDGVVQSQNINWNFTTNPNLIVVGSVDPAGNISSFSNQPGEACLLANGTACAENNKLKYRFVTAPGELILVSDGQGGVTRKSGTSFAAPLVSGTIALIHDRWPWLANYPAETVDIILKSARDVGDPGVDPVYGWGILDATAALSPLSFNGLKWYTYKDGKIAPEQQNKIRNPKEVAKWEAKGMFFYAYEDIGKTFRDFAIPVSSKLVGQSATSYTGSTEYLQAYIYSRFLAWVNTGGKTSNSGPGSGFTGFAYSSPISNSSGLDLSMAVAPRTFLPGYRSPNVPYQSALRLTGPDGRFAITAGEGDGAVMLGDSGFGMASDHDPFTGGVNPLMGFASGGGYLETRVRFGDSWSVSTGLSQRVLKRDLERLDMLEQFALGSIDAYRAGAQHVTVAYETPEAKLTGTYTRLREDNALLGVQSLDPNDFADGTTTDGVSLGAELGLSPTLSLAATGTMSRTRAGGSGQSSIAVSDGGLVSSSFQLGLTKDRLFGRKDRARLTLAQPMHLERGGVDLTTVQVINRQTGELGPVTQRFNLGVPERQFVAEMMYGASMLDGAAELSVFGRATLNGEETDQLPRVMAGAGFKFRF